MTRYSQAVKADYKRPINFIKKFIHPSTTIYTPFTSSYSPSATLYELQGIKINPYETRGCKPSYIMTGTTGSAFAAGGVGAIYVGAIDGKSTSEGSGSGQWINFEVPFDGATGTSCYGADILSRGRGPGRIGNVALVGTWTNSSENILGFYYEGSLNQLKNDSADPGQFKSFQAVTGDDKDANYTYLHSVDGGYAVGNFTTTASLYLDLFLNTGPGSGSYIYKPKTNSQLNVTYQNDKYSYHTLFGIWQNNNNSYTISGGGSTQDLLTDFKTTFQNLPSLVQAGLPSDAAFGRGMLADIDPVTGIAKNEKYYNYQNDPSDLIYTHFQGIYYAGKEVYEVPFDSVTSTGELKVGIAYIKRKDNGSFSENALWQTFEAPHTALVSNDSVAGAGSVGAGAALDSSLTTFASTSDTNAYLFAAQSLC